MSERRSRRSVTPQEENFRGDMLNEQNGATPTVPEPVDNSEYENAVRSTERHSRRSTMSEENEYEEPSEDFTIDPDEWGDMATAVEPYVITDTKPRLVRITEVKPGVKKDGPGAGQKFCIINFDFPDEPYAKEFNTFINFPHPSLTPTQLNAATFYTNAFAECFSIDPSRDKQPVYDWHHKTGWVILRVQHDKSGQFPDQNKVAKFVRGSRR